MSRRWERRVAGARAVERILGFLLGLYSVFLGLLSLVHAAIPQQLPPDPHWYQKTALYLFANIEWVVSVGAGLCGILLVSYLVSFLGNRRLGVSGQHHSCVMSLLQAAHAALTDGQFLNHGCRIVLYKAYDQAVLKAIAGTDGAPSGEKRYRISRHDPNANEGKVAECWYENRVASRNVGSRVYPRDLQANHAWAKSVVTLPVVVAANEPPWGVVCVYSRKRLRAKECDSVVQRLSAEGDFLTTLESLFEKQNLETSCYGLRRLVLSRRN